MTATNGIADYIGKRPVAAASLALAAILVINIIFSLTVIRGQDGEIARLKGEFEHGGRSRAGLPGGMAGLEALRKSLPDKQGLTEVINEVFRAAKKSGLKIPAGDYGPETVKEAGVSRYSISFPVEGRYEQIKGFIFEVETLKHPVVVEEVMLSGSKTEEGVIGLKINISVYFL